MSLTQEVSCLKCRNLWIAISLLALATTIVLGFAFFDWKLKFPFVDPYFIINAILYGLATVVLTLTGCLAFREFKAYCTSPKQARESFDLVIGTVCTFIAIVVIIGFVHFTPTLFIEDQLTKLDEQERLQAIKNLDCRSFVTNVNIYSDFYYSGQNTYIYALNVYDKNENKMIPFQIKHNSISSEKTSLTLDQAGIDDLLLKNENLDNEWIQIKYLECRK